MMQNKLARLISFVFPPKNTNPRNTRKHAGHGGLHLDMSVLEDRTLLSASPLMLIADPGGVDLDSVDSLNESESFVETAFEPSARADIGHAPFQALKPVEKIENALAKAPFDLDRGHLDTNVHFDLDGNEYHALTFLPKLEEAATVAQDIAPAEGPIALSDTFLLHSNPGASHTIFLDFDGHVTSGTPWNSSFNGGSDIVTPAFDFDANVSLFSDTELERIQYIWQRAAEDFIPFDVDVTTEDPGLDALTYGGGGDTDWGVRVAIGGSSSDWFGSSAGGVAYVGSFGWSSDTPAFVFEDMLFANEKYVAEAVSHEVGHALGLGHDGRTNPSESYYSGHGSGETGWAPVMGDGFYTNLTQWSSGEYLYASNTQDDLSIITSNNGFDYRSDDHGNDNGSASLLAISGSTVSGSGIIERNTDVDVFEFTTDGGSIDLQIDPFQRGPNLDILVALYDSADNLIASDNPSDLLDARLSLTVAPGQYFVHVSGTGAGDVSGTGYSDYGSLGQYSISGTVAPSSNEYLSVVATDAVKLEGDTGSTAFTFTVNRTGDTSGSTTVDYAVSGSGSNSTSAADFSGGVQPTGTVAFAVGETSKTVTVSIAGELDVESDENFTLNLTNASGDAQIANQAATGTIVNDDVAATPQIIVTPVSGLTTKESGTSATFEVVLGSKPTADVVVSVTSLDTTEGIVDKSALTFTATNWNNTQSVTITGVDDAVRDGHVQYHIQVGQALSADSNYDGMDPEDVFVTNQDNEKGKGGGGNGGGGNGGGGNGGGGKGGGGKGGPKKSLVPGNDAIVDSATIGALVMEFGSNSPYVDVFTFEFAHGFGTENSVNGDALLVGGGTSRTGSALLDSYSRISNNETSAGEDELEAELELNWR